MSRGKFITFEGCEGVGKSTQVKLLNEYLIKTNQDALFLREPGGTNISEKIRGLILDVNNSEINNECELLLYSASRAQLVYEKIKPAIDNGMLVICDRFIDSTMAYQGFARNLGTKLVGDANALACGEYMPDITIFLDLTPKLAFARKGGADKQDRLEQQSFEFHENVYKGYKWISQNEPDRFFSIEPLGTKYETHNQIINLLKSKGIIK